MSLIFIFSLIKGENQVIYPFIFPLNQVNIPSRGLTIKGICEWFTEGTLRTFEGPLLTHQFSSGGRSQHTSL